MRTLEDMITKSPARLFYYFPQTLMQAIHSGCVTKVGGDSQFNEFAKWATINKAFSATGSALREMCESGKVRRSRFPFLLLGLLML